MYKNLSPCANNDHDISFERSWSQIEASAPGKFILSGEYSVVYGKHAVAVSIDLRTRVTIRPNKSNRVNIDLRNIQQARSWPTEVLAPLRVVNKPGQVLDYEEESLLRELMPVLDAKYIDTSHRCLYKPSERVDNENDDGDDGSRLRMMSSNFGIDNNNKRIITTKTTTTTTDSRLRDPTSASHASDPAVHNYLDYSNEDPQTIDRCGRDATIAFLLLYIGISDSYSASFRPAIDVIIESQLPVGCGLGSSSAFSVALCGALMKVNRIEPELSTISNWALAIDKYFHGTPSGIDNNIITYGGSILFQQGQIMQHGNKQLINLCAILVDSGVLRRTKDICNKVADQKREHPNIINSIFDTIDIITKSAWDVLNHPININMPEMDYLLKKNQKLLECLDIGHPALTDIINISAEHGFCAKLTGAGGGGTAFILIDSSCQDSHSLDQLKTTLRANNYRFYQTRICGAGLQVNTEITTTNTTHNAATNAKINSAVQKTTGSNNAPVNYRNC